MNRSLLSIGECMLEFTSGSDGVWHLGYAGDTFNTAWNFRLAMKDPDWEVAYFTRLGRDVHSDRMIAFMEGHGISTRWIERDETRQPGLYLVETKNGERSFTYWRDHSAARLLADDPDVLARACAAADAVYFSGITLAILSRSGRQTLLDALASAKAAGKPVAFDSNLRPRLWESADVMRDWVKRASAVSTIALPSFEDEQVHFGDADLDACTDRYLAAGVGEVVVKNGGAAMLIVEAGGSHHITDLEKVEPVDTTGAGDSFNGAYLAARFAGCAPVFAAHKAHAQACRTVLQRGALLPMQQH